MKKGSKQSPDARKKMSIAKKGTHPSVSTEFKAGHVMTTAVRKKISKSSRGEKHWNWKGDKVGYIGIHLWMIKTFGRPSTCEFCNKRFKNGSRKLHWANKSGKYKRDRLDWHRLCVSCHKLFDLARIKTSNFLR
jgi:hypothetical protein